MGFSKKLMIGAVVAVMGVAASAYNDKDFFNVHKEYAGKGDVPAKLNTGWNYSNGVGTQKNPGAARSYYRDAANKGDIIAMFYLGMDFEAQRRYNDAITWYKKAADAKNGHEVAMFKVAEFYRKKKDWKNAAVYYKKSAEKGYVPAQVEYAEFCAMGTGVPMNWKEAVRWYEKAAKPNTAIGFAGDTKSQFRLAECYEKGRGVAKNMKKAVEFYQKAAAEEHAESQFRLAECYAKGNGVAKSKDWAVYWYRKAATNGIAKAREALKTYGLN